MYNTAIDSGEEMLLNKPQTPPYIKVFKLSTGEEIISKVVSETNQSFIISKQLQMAMGQRGLQFAPALIMIDQDSELELIKDKIVMSGNPVPEIESQYESLTTGIALPAKSSIIKP
jgi:hypothetical protein